MDHMLIRAMAIMATVFAVSVPALADEYSYNEEQDRIDSVIMELSLSGAESAIIGALDCDGTEVCALRRDSDGFYYLVDMTCLQPRVRRKVAQDCWIAACHVAVTGHVHRSNISATSLEQLLEPQTP